MAGEGSSPGDDDTGLPYSRGKSFQEEVAGDLENDVTDLAEEVS